MRFRVSRIAIRRGLRSGLESRLFSSGKRSTAEAAASEASSASWYDSVEDIGILPIVKTESEFVQVQREIFCRHLVVVADLIQPAEKDAPSPTSRGSSDGLQRRRHAANRPAMVMNKPLDLDRLVTVIRDYC
jgi:hypothetical protein